MEQTKGVNASATVVNAKTGEILATTQRPTYNSDTLEGQAKRVTTGSTAFMKLSMSQGQP